MQTVNLMRKIRRLPVQQRFYVIEKTLESIRKEKYNENNMETAAEALLGDYKNDKELTAFVSLDFEDFYEAK